MLNGSIDKTCFECGQTKHGDSPAVDTCSMIAVKGLFHNSDSPLETRYEMNPNMSRLKNGCNEQHTNKMEQEEKELRSNEDGHLTNDDSTIISMVPDSNIIIDINKVYSKQNGIRQINGSSRELKSEFSPLIEIDNNSMCQGNNKSISVDRLQVSSSADEPTLFPREVNRLSNGKREQSSLSTPTNNRSFKTTPNDDTRKQNLMVCHEEDCDKEKDTLFSKSKYRSSLNSTDCGAVNRNRKRSFMNLPQRCHVPKAIQISSETKKETKLARISLCIVWLFIFCHVWKLIPTAYETFFTEDMGVGLNIEWPYWLDIVKEISHSLITINSGLNFLIYIVL